MINTIREGASMYKRCVTEKGAVWQRTFEETLLNWMKDTPFDEISVRALCAETGISRKTFYRLFTSKEAVLCALIDSVYLDYVNYKDPTIHAESEEIQELQNFFSYWLMQKPLLDALHANQKTGLLIERSVDYIMSDDSHIRRFFGISNPNDCREYLMFYSSGIMSMVLSWHLSGYQKSIAEMADVFYTILTTPPAHRNL